MPSVTSDQTPNGWLLNPASNLVLFLSNETMISGLTQRVLLAAEMVPPLLTLVSPQLTSLNPENEAALARLVEFSRTDAAFAREEIGAGFNTILSHHAVATWAAIETAIEQTLLNAIRKIPASESLILAATPTLNADRFRTRTTGDASKALRHWEAEAKQKHSFDRSIQMLAVLGFSLVVSETNRRLLIELSEVRNVILHRGGIADDRFVEKCDWVKVKPGQKVVVRPDQMTAYIDAAHGFAIELIRAATKSPHIFIRPKPARGSDD